MQMSNTEPRAAQLLSIQAAAQQLGVSRSTTYRLVGDRKLTMVKLGDRALITQASVDALVARLEAAADGADK